MAYYLISDFRAGLDTRRLTESAQAGSLRELQNGFVNSGGEVQKLQGFVVEDTLTTALNEAANNGGWVGPVRTSDGSFVFAGPGTIPPSFPNFVGGVATYWSQLSNQLVNPEGLAGSDVFGANVYLAVQYDQFTGVKTLLRRAGPNADRGDRRRCGIARAARADHRIEGLAGVWPVAQVF